MAAKCAGNQSVVGSRLGEREPKRERCVSVSPFAWADVVGGYGYAPSRSDASRSGGSSKINARVFEQKTGKQLGESGGGLDETWMV